jgi:hypothetical protein
LRAAAHALDADDVASVRSSSQIQALLHAHLTGAVRTALHNLCR